MTKKKLVRIGTFETNSSSSHSLSIDFEGGQTIYEGLEDCIEDEEVWLNCGECDFSENLRLNKAKDKIAFLAAMWNSYAKELNEYYNLKSLKKAIKKNTGCKKVHLYNIQQVTDDVEDSLDNLELLGFSDYLYDLIFDPNRYICKKSNYAD